MQSDQPEKSRVGIVGAGLAGLATAYYLTRAGYRVTIFEASRRLGGRVKTDNGFVRGRFVELGAELIGANHIIWLQLARRFGLSLSTVTEAEDFDFMGLKGLLNIGGKPSALCDRTLFFEMQNAFTRLNEHAANIDAHKPWGRRIKCVPRTVIRSPLKSAEDAVAKDGNGFFYEHYKYDYLNVKQWIDDLPNSSFSSDTKTLIGSIIENNQAVSPEKQSYLGLLAAVKGGCLGESLLTLNRPSKYWTHSEYFRCADGNSSLPEKLREKADQTNLVEFEFETPVKRVEANHEGAAVVTSNGTRNFDWIVLAAPASTFLIEIDEKDKIYRAKYNRNDDEDDFNLMHRSDDAFHGRIVCPRNIPSGPAVKYISRVGSRFWINDQKAASGFDTNLGGFWESTDNQGGVSQYAITLFGGGRLAKGLASQAKRRLNHQIKQHFPHFKPMASRLCNWADEPWIFTGYSCPAPGDVTTIAPLLCKPQGRLVFAGEHTSMAFFGYMEGALYSGLRSARHIAQKHIEM